MPGILLQEDIKLTFRIKNRAVQSLGFHGTVIIILKESSGL